MTEQKQFELKLLIQFRNSIKEQLFYFEQIIQTEKEISQVLPYLDDQNYILLDPTMFERIIYLKDYLKNITNKIEEKCTHNFIKDSIDIGPDESTNIHYCSICELQL
jgi:hypothetical protein